MIPIRFLMLTTVVFAGCAGSQYPEPGRTPTTPKGRYITADEIQATGASNAWEALKYTVRTHQFKDYRGVPQRIDSDRGIGSIMVREEPLIYVDRARLSDIEVLRYIPATQIVSIRVMTGADAMMRYGTNSSAGVILIQTISDADPGV